MNLESAEKLPTFFRVSSEGRSSTRSISTSASSSRCGFRTGIFSTQQCITRFLRSWYHVVVARRKPRYMQSLQSWSRSVASAAEVAMLVVFVVCVVFVVSWKPWRSWGTSATLPPCKIPPIFAYIHALATTTIWLNCFRNSFGCLRLSSSFLCPFNDDPPPMFKRSSGSFEGFKCHGA